MIKSFKASEKIVQNRFVKSVDGEVTPCTASTDNILGICEPNSGEFDGWADINISETAEIEAGAAFEIGDALTSDADGCAVKASAGDNIGAIALDDATAAGDIVQVLLCLQRNLSGGTDAAATSSETASQESE